MLFFLLVDCYHGIGVGYRGNVNVTRSGRTCQSWGAQCPHLHSRIPEDVVDGQNDSNMCRNPDGSSPDGPWCYTVDPKVRWEYCNVSRCPLRGNTPFLNSLTSIFFSHEALCKAFYVTQKNNFYYISAKWSRALYKLIPFSLRVAFLIT